MILQLAISGHSFGGADVPGFYGKVTDDLFVKFY
jgi:alpha-glucosidase (family GH31 glycosyl hydrolase)